MKPSDCQCYTCKNSVSMWCKFYLEYCDEGRNCDNCIDSMDDCTEYINEMVEEDEDEV